MDQQLFMSSSLKEIDVSYIYFYFQSHRSELRASETGSWSINMQYLIGLSVKSHVDVGIQQMAEQKSLAFWFLTAELEKRMFLDLVSRL